MVSYRERGIEVGREEEKWVESMSAIEREEERWGESMVSYREREEEKWVESMVIGQL